MSYLVGTGSKVGVAKQTTWDVTVQPTSLVNITSESLALTKEIGDEGNLIASKVKSAQDTLGFSVDGSLSSVLRPETADWLFECLMGVKTSTSVADNTYTLQEPNQDLPVSTVVIERGGIAKTYPNCTIKSVSLDCAAQDYVQCNIDIAGIRELAAGTTGAQTIPSALKFSKPSYRCTHASLVYGSSNTLDVESSSIKFDNGVTDGPKVYSSGLYKTRPICGMRDVSIDFKIPYSAEVDAFRQTYFLPENDPKADYVLKFTTNNQSEYIEITFKNVQITDGGNNVGGTGLIESSFTGVCIDDFTNAPVSVRVVHASAVED